tara:strand:+ start:2493 stop:2819 length:327 start_codon:yes stop_codon:yes gene_type:complete
MSFKIKPPYSIDNTPIYFVEEEEGVLGRANMNGTITINSKVKSPNQVKEIIKHEKVHIDQMKDGRLAYDDNNIYHRKSGKGKWKVKKRSNKVDGSPSSWWEKEAYNKK